MYTFSPNEVPYAVGKPKAKPPLEIWSNLRPSANVVDNHFDRLNVNESLLVHQSLIDPDNNGNWRWDLTKAWIDEHQDYVGGPVCLDWEGYMQQVIKAGPNHSDWKRVMLNVKRCLYYCERWLSQGMFGLYGVPLKVYSGQDRDLDANGVADWVENTLALSDVVKYADAIYVSVYDYYGFKPERDHERFGNIVRLGLRLSDGKPTYAYTSHRYHISTDEWGFKRIPKDEYIAHVRNAMQVDYDNHRCAGVVCWGADKYYHTAAHAKNADGSWKRTGAIWDRRRTAFAEEMREGETIDEFVDRIYVEVLEDTREALTF